MNRFFLVLSITFLFFSCKSDDNSENPAEEVNFFALTEGNTWEYEFFKRVQNQSNEFVNLGVQEKITIIGTEEINGEQFYNFEITTTNNSNTSGCTVCKENGTVNYFYRDSLGYLIDNGGVIHFSSNNTNEYLVLEQNWGTTYGYLNPTPQDISVDAGSFTTKENIVFAILNDGTEGTGMDRSYYSDEEGLILQKYATVQSQNHLFEKRLKSYSVSNN